MEEMTTNLEESIVQLRIAVERISVLLDEREKTIELHKKSIDGAWDTVRKLQKDLTMNDEETHKIEQRQQLFEKHLEDKLDKLSEQIEKLRESSESRAAALEHNIHLLGETKFQVKLLWGAFTTAMLGAIGAFIKLFTK
jgi:hypothetical protein